MRIGVDSYSSVRAMDKGIGSQKCSDIYANPSKTVELHKDALFSTANCVTGESVSVYYAEKIRLLEKHDGKLPLYTQNKYSLYS